MTSINQVFFVINVYGCKKKWLLPSLNQLIVHRSLFCKAVHECQQYHHDGISTFHRQNGLCCRMLPNSLSPVFLCHHLAHQRNIALNWLSESIKFAQLLVPIRLPDVHHFSKGHTFGKNARTWCLLKIYVDMDVCRHFAWALQLAIFVSHEKLSPVIWDHPCCHL